MKATTITVTVIAHLRVAEIGGGSGGRDVTRGASAMPAGGSRDGAPLPVLDDGASGRSDPARSPLVGAPEDLRPPIGLLPCVGHAPAPCAARATPFGPPGPPRPTAPWPAGAA